MNINFKIFFQTLFFLLIQISLGTCITKPAVVEPKIVTKVEVKYEYKYVPVLKKHPSESNIKESIHRFYKETIPSLKEKKIALVTNPSGIGRDPFTLKDTLQKHSVHLSFLLALEHGILGLEEDFSNKVQTQDKILEVPAYHVYRLKRKQLQALLKEVDAVVFDVQGMGIRCYTYLTVLKRIMDVLSEKTELIVLDHIPPGLSLGIRGDTLEKPYKNFAAEFPLPFITGLSIGEAALYYNHEFLASRVKLKVLKVENYKRNIPYEASGLPWYTPSPNLPGLESARNYYSLVLLEGTNLSVGRGTQAPFIYFGAPYLKKASEIAAELNKNAKGDFFFQSVFFKPAFGPYKGEICFGMKLSIFKNDYDPIQLSYELIKTIKKYHPEEFQWREFSGKFFLDNLWGNPGFRKSIDANLAYDSFYEVFAKKEKLYQENVKKYYLYPEK